jgi:hypothetical protein
MACVAGFSVLRKIGPDVHHPAHAQAEEAAAAVERELALEVRRAAVVVADDGLEARAHPLHRLAELARGEHERAVLGIRLRADAESAADVVRVDADLLRRHAGDCREIGQHERQALRAGVNVEAFGIRVVRDEAGLRLHRRAGDARGVERQPSDVRRRGERRLGSLLVAVHIVEGKVARDLVVQLRCPRLERGARIHHRRQVAVFDVDRFGRVLRRRRRRGDHQSDLLSDVAHALPRDDVAMRHLDGRAALAGVADHGRGRFEVGGILARQNRFHPRKPLRRLQRQDLRMRAIRAQEIAVELLGQIPVRGVPAAAGQEAVVFATTLELLHAGCGQDCQATNFQPCGVRVQALRKSSRSDFA